MHTYVAVAEQPGVAILDNAKPPIDMIAIETHGRGGLSRLLIGSAQRQGNPRFQAANPRAPTDDRVAERL